MSGSLAEFFYHDPIYELVQVLGRAPAGPHDPQPEPVEWEVLRYRRLMDLYMAYSAFRQRPDSVAAQLDYVARTFDPDCLAACTPDVRYVWERAARVHGGSVPELLATLADLMRLAGTGPAPDYDEIPLARWEAEQRYPNLCKVRDYVDDASHLETAEAVRTAVLMGHPASCDEEVPPLASQGMEALALCKQHRKFRKRMEAFMNLTSDALALIVDTACEHMKAEHRTGSATAHRTQPRTR